MIKQVWEMLLGTVCDLAGAFSGTLSMNILFQPEDVFPIPEKFTYCEISYWRGEDRIYLTVRNRSKPWQQEQYALDTTDVSRVRRMVEADGFSPTRAYLGLLVPGTSFNDAESDTYFYTR